MVSLLTTYPSPDQNLRDVYIRVKNLAPADIQAARKELASRFQVLYVVEEGEFSTAS
jgi:hypothetical protein